MSANAPADLLAWDTQFFGCRIGRARGDTLDEPLASRLLQWCHDHQIDCLYFLARPDDPATVQAAQAHGFSLVDIRVTLERQIDAAPGAPPLPGIRPARDEDLPALQDLARSAHTDTRFFADPHFQRERARELYATWITRDYQRQPESVWVAASSENRPLGYITCQWDPVSPQSAASIGLIAVAPESRGGGIAKNLVAAALGSLAGRGATLVTVATQIRNVPAQRLYETCGFRTKEVRLWYHWWHPTC